MRIWMHEPVGVYVCVCVCVCLIVSCVVVHVCLSSSQQPPMVAITWLPCVVQPKPQMVQQMLNVVWPIPCVI